MTEIEEIKKKLDIVDVVGRYLPLKKRGRHYVACCPFHQEKTPSFIISPELQIFKCFGCGKAGDMFTFVEEFERIDFKEALEDLAALAGVKLTRSFELTREESRKKKLLEINAEVAKFYHYILLHHPLGRPALGYLQNRGLKPETIALFKIGFSPQNPQLIGNYLIKKGFAPDDLIATGTFGRSQYHRGELYDRFQDRLIFPLLDARQNFIGFSGRTIPGLSKVEAAKYINSPETDLYHKSSTLFGIHLAREAIKKTNSVIVVEGEFDMISPYQAGIKNIVAIKGTAFTADQLQILRRYTDTLILGLDSDFAGNNAARKSIELADSMEFDLKVLELPSGLKDPDEAVKKDPQIFRDAVDRAVPVWDFLINSAVRGNDANTIKGKRAILTLVLPFLVKIQNQVIRSDYLGKLAAAIGSSPNSVTAESLRYLSDKTASAVVVSTQANPVTKTEKTEEYLLSLVFSARKPVKLIKSISSDYQFVTPKLATLAASLSKKKLFLPQKFAAGLPAELQPTFDSIYLLGTSFDLDARHRRLEIKKTLSQLLSAVYKSRLGELSVLIAQAEGQSHPDQLKTLEMEYNQILGKISRLQSR